MRPLVWARAAIVLVATLAGPPRAAAAVIAVGAGAFGAGSTLTTFDSLADGLEVNGLTVDGILFGYSLGDGMLIIDGGPGVTNNINPPNIVSVGDNTGILTFTIPSLVDTFGYGYSLLSLNPIPNATTISLFNGATPVGSLSYAASLDPFFAGGFAGIQSTLPFNRVEATFDSASAPAFAVDNIRTASGVVPEPGTLLLMLTGIGTFLARRGRRTAGA